MVDFVLVGICYCDYYTMWHGGHCVVNCGSRKNMLVQIPLCNSALAAISQYFALNDFSRGISELFKSRSAIAPMQPLFNNTCTTLE